MPPMPTFLQRNKENNVTHAEHSVPKDTPEITQDPPQEITIDMLMEQIKKLSAKRDEIQVTLSGLKKQAQSMIGRL
jgi:hypothetical protein